MIVLKATQDKILSLLQLVAGIVERQHTLPILTNVLIRKTGVNSLELVAVFEPNQAARAVTLILRPDPAASHVSGGSVYLANYLKAIRNRAMSVVPRCVGFFSSSKANLRNAP